MAIELHHLHPVHDDEVARLKARIVELEARNHDLIEDLRARLPKWHRCDEPFDGKLYDLPPESGMYFAQYEVTWADGETKRYCEPLEYDADNCDWPQLTNICKIIQWCENPIPPEVK